MANTGSLATTDSAVTAQLDSSTAIALAQITGTWTGTLNFEASADGGTTWVAVRGVSGTATATSTTSNGNWRLMVGGYTQARVRFNPASSGTAVVAINTSSAEDSVVVQNIPAVGSAASAASIPVVIASDQAAFVVNPVAPTENTYLASGSRNSTQTQGDQTNATFKGIAVILDVTVIGTGNITLEIDAKDALSGKYYVLLTGAAVSSNSTNVYTVYPSIVNAANVSASNVLPKTWRIKVTANNGNAVTYSVGYNLLP